GKNIGQRLHCKVGVFLDTQHRILGASNQHLVNRRRIFRLRFPPSDLKRRVCHVSLFRKLRYATTLGRQHSCCHLRASHVPVTTKHFAESVTVPQIRVKGSCVCPSFRPTIFSLQQRSSNKRTKKSQLTQVKTGSL